MTIFGSFGGFFFKKASSPLENSKKISSLLMFLAIGGFFYISGAVVNIILLKKLPYSIVFPLTSVTYIWTMIISKIWLNERITSRKLLGVTLILIGCVLLSYNKLN
ncbi:EamA family transporter [Bacillus marasmi]|uniref:EamA family transporter n=1 Tax=Bacillus marasmi TaxID=1926279 RepID=UPI0011CCA404|nr:EamA family transporter [Bacillus marasmi]